MHSAYVVFIQENTTKTIYFTNSLLRAVDEN